MLPAKRARPTAVQDPWVQLLEEMRQLRDDIAREHAKFQEWRDCGLHHTYEPLRFPGAKPDLVEKKLKEFLNSKLSSYKSYCEKLDSILTYYKNAVQNNAPLLDNIEDQSDNRRQLTALNEIDAEIRNNFNAFYKSVNSFSARDFDKWMQDSINTYKTGYPNYLEKNMKYFECISTNDYERCVKNYCQQWLEGNFGSHDRSDSEKTPKQQMKEMRTSIAGQIQGLQAIQWPHQQQRQHVPTQQGATGGVNPQQFAVLQQQLLQQQQMLSLMQQQNGGQMHQGVTAVWTPALPSTSSGVQITALPSGPVDEAQNNQIVPYNPHCGYQPTD